MAGKSGKIGDKTGKSGGSRDKRLAAALRENLRRRKAQARGRERGPASEPDPAPSREGRNPGPRSQS